MAARHRDHWEWPHWEWPHCFFVFCFLFFFNRATEFAEKSSYEALGKILKLNRYSHQSFVFFVDLSDHQE